jgi:hypothetical protein
MNNLLAGLGRFAVEALRAIRNHQYEFTESGIYLPRPKVVIGGTMAHRVRRAGGEFGPWQLDTNRVVTEGLTYIVASSLAGGAQITTFYLAPFQANVDVPANWTGANFAQQAQEFTGYTNSTRLPWKTTMPTTPEVGNGANLTDSTMEVSGTAGPYSITGAAVLSASAKSANTGKLIAAAKFSTIRSLETGDELSLRYTFTAKDEGDA